MKNVLHTYKGFICYSIIKLLFCILLRFNFFPNYNLILKYLFLNIGLQIYIYRKKKNDKKKKLVRTENVRLRNNLVKATVIHSNEKSTLSKHSKHVSAKV